jgi:exonuclease VII small subunit
MEELLQTVQTNWPVIVEYALMFVAYFLVFLYKSKINNTNRDLRTVFKDNVKLLKDAESKLRDDVMIQLEQSIKAYNSAISLIADLERRILVQEKTMNALLGGEDDETDTNTET